jgi:hypothetical protein
VYVDVGAILVDEFSGAPPIQVLPAIFSDIYSFAGFDT